MVERAIPVISNTASRPPHPAARASPAANTLRPRSSSFEPTASQRLRIACVSIMPTRILPTRRPRNPAALSHITAWRKGANSIQLFWRLSQGRETTAMSLLPVEPAWRLAERAEEHRWLVTGLWAEQAVGIVGGEPKCCKSFLALDLAVAVAAGAPCLRRFSVSRAGRVLLFAAEDALHIVRRRLEGIATAAGVALADLDIQVITAPVLRPDLDADRRNLAETVARLQPRLLILDPFVRLHRIDENASGEVAPLLA